VHRLHTQRRPLTVRTAGELLWTARSLKKRTCDGVFAGGGAQDFGYEVNAPLPPEAKKILKI